MCTLCACGVCVVYLLSCTMVYTWCTVVCMLCAHGVCVVYHGVHIVCAWCTMVCMWCTGASEHILPLWLSTRECHHSLFLSVVLFYEPLSEFSASFWICCVCTPCHVHHAVYTTSCTPCHVHHAMYTMPCTSRCAHHIVYTMPCTPHCAHHIMYTTSCTPCHVHHVVYTTPYTPHHVHHSTPHTPWYTTFLHTMLWCTFQSNLTPKSCDHSSQPIRRLHSLKSLWPCEKSWDLPKIFPPFKEQSCYNSSAKNAWLSHSSHSVSDSSTTFEIPS